MSKAMHLFFLSYKSAFKIRTALNNNKEKYYFPDIYIPHINKIIEVKSTWTYKCDTDVIKLKKNATELLGYEIWIYNCKGIKEVIECNK
jgi:hypothetical protein